MPGAEPALEGKPADLTVGLHVCRGNFRSTRIRKAVTSRLPRCCLAALMSMPSSEYDNDRSGDFAPLRFIRPGHQQVVLGLITTKTASWRIRKG